MIFCKKCGTELNDTAAFCRNCGAPVAPPEFTEDSVQEKKAGLENLSMQLREICDKMVAGYASASSELLTVSDSVKAEAAEKVEEMEKTLHEKEDECVRLQNLLSSRDEQILRLQEALSGKEAELNELQAALAAKNEEAGRLQESLEQLRPKEEPIVAPLTLDPFGTAREEDAQDQALPENEDLTVGVTNWAPPVLEKDAPAPAPVASGPMFCPNCGSRLEPDMIFCAECGTRVR